MGSYLQRLFFLSLLQVIWLLPVDSVKAQSVHEFTYRSPNNPSKGNISLLLVRFPGGSGYARLRFTDSTTRNAQLINCTATEETIELADGSVRTDATLITLSSPEVIQGNGGTSYQPDRFITRINTKDTTTEPAALVTGVANGIFTETAFLTTPAATRLGNTFYTNKYFIAGEPVYEDAKNQGRGGIGTLPGKGRKLHLLMVASTGDAVLGKYASRDLNNMYNLFYFIYQPLGFEVKPQYFQKDTYNRQAVEKSIADLKVDTGDVIIFYYTGHGFNETRGNPKKRPYPRMLLTNMPDHLSAKEFARSSVSVQDTYKALLRKKAKSCFVFTDCCNSEVEAFRKTSIDVFLAPSTSKGIQQFNPEACKRLFIDSSVNILAVATSRGEKARTANEFMGSFFSWSLQESFQSKLAAGSNLKSVNYPGWTDIMNTTKAKVAYYMNPANKKCAAPAGEECKMTPVINIQSNQ
jgi:hypothetical protein